MMAQQKHGDMKFDNMDQMVHEAEATFRKGLGSLVQWGEQVRSVLQDKPASILGAAGISGLVAGALIRSSVESRRSAGKGSLRSAKTSRDSSGILVPPSSSLHQNVPIDPVVLLAGGLAVGLSIGPKLIEQALNALSRYEQGDTDSTWDVDGARLRATGSMNAKPFEK
jgi:hypothetical protein